jgi:hypothetical protein
MHASRAATFTPPGGVVSARSLPRPRRQSPALSMPRPASTPSHRYDAPKRTALNSVTPLHAVMATTATASMSLAGAPNMARIYPVLGRVPPRVSPGFVDCSSVGPTQAVSYPAHDTYRLGVMPTPGEPHSAEKPRADLTSVVVARDGDPCASISRGPVSPARRRG